MVTKTTPPAGNQEEGLPTESLDDLAQAGADLDQPAAPAPTKADQAVLASETEEIETALLLLRAAAVPLAPDHTQGALAQVWSDKQLSDIAKALVECARASGITVTSWFGKHGHWVRLGFSLGMPALATVKILRMPPPRQVQTDGQHQQA